MTEKELLLTSILNCPRSSLYSGAVSLSCRQHSLLEQALSLRALGFPLQYILGQIEFFGLNFKVDRRVFIPRPETEILVETAIEKVKGQRLRVKVLDIGTGSGCIAISLAKILPQAEITAIDISGDALEVAKENAVSNLVADRISFIQGDALCCYDLIVSNPPYIPSADIGDMQKEISYEPRIALDGGADGLDFYRRIIKESPKFLEKDGLLIMEIGFGQREDVVKIASQERRLEILEVIKDYSDIERVVIFTA